VRGGLASQEGVGGVTPQPSWVHYFPVATTVVAMVFSARLAQRYRARRQPNLLWWAIGIACYGLGTLFEASITLFGNSVALTKAWYVAGAVLGGYPLAQGSVYLLYSRRFATAATALTLPIIVLTSLLVWVSPVHLERLEPHRPSGAILAWSWVRLMTPLINTYAVFFLVGGAIRSAWRYARQGSELNRAVGNSFIAAGAILPGIGGSIAKGGPVEPLYVLEFLGLLLIWAGDRVCARRRHPVRAVTAARVGSHAGPDPPPSERAPATHHSSVASPPFGDA
jgi:hypothetical protein